MSCVINPNLFLKTSFCYLRNDYNDFYKDDICFLDITIARTKNTDNFNESESLILIENFGNL